MENTKITENKYFTPDIQDIKVGAEIYFIKDPSIEIDEDNLLKMILTPKQVSGILFPPLNWEREDTDNYKPIFPSLLVPYLTKEQIEAERWNSVENDDYMFVFKKHPEVNWTYTIRVDFEDYRMEIDEEFLKLDNSIVISTLFAGECKDINTFRYICKLLGING